MLRQSGDKVHKLFLFTDSVENYIRHGSVFKGFGDFPKKEIDFEKKNFKKNLENVGAKCLLLERYY